jgi:hypothetical protein
MIYFKGYELFTIVDIKMTFLHFKFCVFQIRQIFTNTGVKMTGETFENLFNFAAKKHPKGFVSVESFRSVLDDLEAAKIEIGEHALAV